MNVLPRCSSLAFIALLSGIFTASVRAGNVAEAWSRRYEAMVSGSAATLDNAGNVIVIVSTSAGNHFQIHAAKYAAATGATLWEKTIAAPGATDTVGVGVVTDAAGNALIGGWANVSGRSAFYTFKLAAADGALVWQSLNSGAEHLNERAWAMAVDSAGNPIVAGNSANAAGDLDAYTIKYAAADGSVLWEHRFDGPTHQIDQIYSVAVDPGGNVAVTGSTFSGTQFDVYVARYAAAIGKSIWDKIYPAPTGGDDVGLSVATDPAGNVAIAAEIELAIDDGPIGAYTAKYAAADGALLWDNSLTRPGADAGPTSVAVDGAGNVFMTGFTTLTGHIDIDFYTAKYAAADGAILWERTYDGTGQGHDQAFDIALDPAGNAIVVGESDNATSPGHPDFQTIKYASENGEVLWQRRYNGPDEADDRLGLTLGRAKVLAAADGGAVITGLSSTPQAQAAVTISYVQDDLTEAPLLTAPASGSFNSNSVAIGYTLPEAALPGSVKLILDDTIETRTLVVAATGESAGTHTFTLDPANPLQGGAIASGPALPDRYYSVTLSYQDMAGNAASSDTSLGVTIDTVAPDISLPTNTTIHTANPNGAALAFEITTNDLFDSTPAIVASPPSGSVFPVGVSQVTVTVTDHSGNVSTTEFPVTVILIMDVPKPISTILAVKNGNVPAAPGSGIPVGSKWVSFSVPSIHNGGAFVGSPPPFGLPKRM
jgi:hypothetical protein